MILETLGKCSWNELEINEIFAYEGCWCIIIKTGKDSIMVLDSTAGVDQHGIEGRCASEVFDILNDRFYKLPLKTQHLWKEE